MNLHNRFFHFFERFIARIEDQSTGIYLYLLSFFFVTFLRNFLELYSDHGCFNFRCFYHFDLSFFFLALLITIIVHFFTKEKIPKVLRLVLFSFTIIILPPIADLVLSGGKGYDMAYLDPTRDTEILMKYLTFWGPFRERGATPGIRIEVALAMIASFFYFRLKRNGILGGIFLAISIYTAIFLFGMTPFLLKLFLNSFGLPYRFSSENMSNIFLLGILGCGIIIFRRYNKNYFMELLKDIRATRILHYQFMFLLGICISYNFHFNKDQLQLTTEILYSLIFLPIALVFAAIFSIIVNNVVDYNIDRITNPLRPSVTKSIPPGLYRNLSILSLILAGIYGHAASFQGMFLIMLFIGIYFLYSSPPYRLKTIPVFSKFLLALNSYVMILMGHIVLQQNVDIPPSIAFSIIGGLGLLLNFIDIKDYEGDLAEGIKTLPTLLGLKRSKFLIGLFFLVIYPLSFLVFREIRPMNNVLIVLFSLIGLLQFLLINRKAYDERPIFLVHLTSFLALLIYLAFYK